MKNHVFKVQLKLWGIVVRVIDVGINASSKELARVYLDLIIKNELNHEGLTVDVVEEAKEEKPSI